MITSPHSGASWLPDAVAALAEYRDESLPGWSRVVLSAPYRASRAFLRRTMEEAGLEVSVDGAGNMIGRLHGTGGETSKPIVTGSHTDTVRGGGRFDGILGVLGAIASVRQLREAGVRLRRDLLVVDFLGEEPNDYGVSCLGSRALAGVLTDQHLAQRNPQGQTLAEALADYGVDPSEVLAAAWRPGDIHAYVELHIEQGPVLERASLNIGVVTGIAGIARFVADYAGRPDHAGGTPMGARIDALAAAAEGVLALERICRDAPVHGVGTVGRVESFPGSMNVVPEAARVWGEMRSIDPEWLRDARADLERRVAEQAAVRNATGTVEWLTSQDPVPTAPDVRAHIVRACGDLGFSWTEIPSGAGHDAAHMARLGPMGMIFVPSQAGRSHCPEEWTDPADLQRGVQTLTSTIKSLDAAESVSS